MLRRIDAHVQRPAVHHDQNLEGLKRLTCHRIPTELGTMFVVHLHVDVRDMMGANAVNTMAELIAPRIESLTGGRVLLRILSTWPRSAWRGLKPL